ncbi:MAG TPA: hypothetical protein VHO68_08610 [Bacteroidales bacterium]|nr:hypothetical protein [Bacteroidales bacterium]
MNYKCTFIIFLLCTCFPVKSQQPDSALASENTAKKLNSFGLFENEEILNISLYFDLTTYLRKKPKEEYLKAEIIFNPGRIDSLRQKVRLRTRGVFRNSYCAFAPIELSFKNAKFGYSDLDSIQKLKLVTQCSSGAMEEKYILREYLAYKLYQVFTDTSFRVRLLKVTYFDTGKDRKPVNQYGIFIEPLEMLTGRTGTVHIRNERLNQKHIIPPVMDRVAFFNYMIGNYDWSVPGQHNIRILKISTNPYGFAVPYDFDWSGFVNATYADPAENVGIQNIRERVYTGVCRSNEAFSREIDLFTSKKFELYNVINNFSYLSIADKKDLLTYLEGFFAELRGRDHFLYYLHTKCKNF